MKFPSIVICHMDADTEKANAIRESLAKQGCRFFLINEFYDEELAKRIKEFDVDLLIAIWTKNIGNDNSIVFNTILAKKYKCKPVIIIYDDFELNPALSSYAIISYSNNDTFYDSLKLEIGLEDNGVKVQISKNKLDCLRAYQDKVKAEMGLLKVLGDEFNRPIEEIYLPLYISQNENQNPIPAENLLAFNQKSFIILGNPGTGKTTLLKYIAYKSFDRRPILFPVYIKITEFLKSGYEFYDFIIATINGKVGRNCTETIRNNEEFCNENAIVLLDGLDENSVNDLEIFYKLLRNFRISYPNCKIIITTRFNGYDNKQFKGYKEFYIEQLRRIDIEKYVYSVCDGDKQRQIFQIFNSDSRLFELAKVPFLLAMICALPDPIGNKATQRSQLYKNCTKYLLRTIDWDEGRPNITDEISLILENALKLIALRFFKLDRQGSFNEEELIFSIRNLKSNSQNLSPNEILAKICDNSGLLQRSGTSLEFIHRSIWEYYVALGMLELEDSYHELFERSTISAWEEPIRLYTGLASERILQEVLSGIWKRNKGLALRCMTEVQKFPDQILESLIKKLNKSERILLITKLKEDIDEIQSILDKKRLITDTLSVLLKVEKDCQVIYSAIEVLENFTFLFKGKISTSECEDLIINKLDLKNADKRREQYLMDKNLYFDFVCVPDSYFMMGTNSIERTINEKPEHPVRLNSYCISKYPITNRLYYDNFPFSVDRRDGYSNRDSQPVVHVNWYEAYIFARWLNCDLPTEAEWENACISYGNDSKLFMNKNNIPEYAWYIENVPTQSAQDVGLKKPNSLGIYDMLGNVREWCKDWFASNYYNECLINGETLNPQGAHTGISKSIRGGCWDWNVSNLFPTYRNMNTPDNIYFVNGFRVVYRNKIVDKLSNL